ncbi:MAG TPA: hypothetical protein VLB29_07820 [Nocardioidaceae bacterium]|nr:hypothetical protein [Nocardioidaceae bacterium]
MSNFDEKDLLTRELRERAADVDGHPIGFDAVRQSARKIRRRRNIVTGAVAAVVASIAIPTGVAVTSAITSPDGKVDDQIVATDPSEKASPEPAPDPRPDGSFPLTLEGLPRGDDPKVSYVLPNEQMLVTPDGRFDLPEAYRQILPYRDGWLALYGGENGWENVILDADLEVRRTMPGGAALSPSADGSRVLYGERVTVPGRTVVVDDPTESDFERDPMNWEAPDNSIVVPVGYVDEQTVVFQTEGGENPFIAMGLPDGSTVPLEGFQRVNSASEANGLVAGQVSSDPMEGACSGVMDPAASTSKMVWETCDYTLYEFSPDGRYIIAGPTYVDMWGPSQLIILDTQTWKPVVEFDPENDTVRQLTQTTWEDEDTVIGILVEGNDMGMVRAELSGRLESVSSTYEATDMSLQMWFAERPSF